MPQVGSAYIVVRAKTTKLSGDMKTAHSQVQNAMGKIEKAVKVAMVASVAAVTLLSRSILTLGLDFEKTMKTVQAWSGATGVDLQRLTDVAREMGRTTEWSANQSAEALKFLAAAGFSVEESIKALPKTLDLATAGQTDLAAASDIVTDVLTAFSMEVEELTRVNNAFITTSSSTNTNVSMLGESMKMVAPTAKLFGLSVEETAAMLGTLANAGVKATMAGSGLNMVLLKSKEAAKALGMDAATPLVEVLKKMKEEQWDATRIGEAFGARQVKTAAILMDGLGTYEKLTKKIVENKTATKDLAAIMRDSLGVDIKTLHSQIQDKMLTVFELFKADLREVVQGMSEWIEKNEALITQNIEATITAIAQASKQVWQVLVQTKAIYDSLPKEVLKYGLYGLAFVGTFGATGVVVAAILAIDRAAKGANVTLKDAIETSKEMAWEYKVFGKWFFEYFVKSWLTTNALMGESSEELLAIIAELTGKATVFTGKVPPGGLLDYLDDLAKEFEDLGDAFPIDENAKYNNGALELVDLTEDRLNPALEEAIASFDTLAAAQLAGYEQFTRNSASIKYMGENLDDLIRKWKDLGDEFPVTEQKAQSFFDGLKDGFKIAEKEQKTFYDHGVTLMKDWLGAIEDGMGDVFYKAFTGNFNEIGDAFEAMLKNMLKSFADMLAEMLVTWARTEFETKTASVIVDIGSGAAGGAAGAAGAGGAGAGASGLVSAAAMVAIAAIAVYVLGKILMPEDTPSYLELIEDHEAGEVTFDDATLQYMKDTWMAAQGAAVEREIFSTQMRDGVVKSTGDWFATIESYFKAFSGDTAATLKERGSGMTMTDEIGALLDAFEKGEIRIGVLFDIATSEKTSFLEKMSALGLIGSKEGWESTATLNFVTAIAQNETMRIQDKLDMLGFIAGESGFEGTATIKFIAELAEQGAGWDLVLDQLRLIGASEEQIATFRIDFIKGKTLEGTEWEALESIFLGTRLDSEDLILKMRLEAEFLGKDNLNWEEFSAFLKREGVDDTIIKQMQIKFLSDDQLDWDTLKSLMGAGGVTEDIMREVFVDFKESGGGLTWQQFEEVLQAKGVSEDIIRNIRMNFLTESGPVDSQQFEDLLKGVGLSDDIIKTIKIKFDSLDGKMTWEQLVDMLEDMGVSDEIINNIIGQLEPSDPLADLADEGLGMHEDLQSLWEEGLKPNEQLSRAINEGIDLNVPDMVQSTSPAGDTVSTVSDLVTMASVGSLSATSSSSESSSSDSSSSDTENDLNDFWENYSRDFREMIGAMTEVEMVIADINEQWNDYIEQAKELGASAEQIAIIEKQRIIALKAAIQDIVNELANFWKDYTMDFRETIGGMTTLETTISDINSKWDDYIEQAKELGASLEDLARLEAQRIVALKAAIQDFVKEVTQGFMDLQNNIADYLNELAGMSSGGVALESLMRWRELQGLSADGMEDLLNLNNMTTDQLTSYAEKLAGYHNALFEEIKTRYDYETQRIEELNGLIDSVAKKIISLRYSSFNLALPSAQASTATGDYTAMFQAAQGGDTGAVNDYLAFIDTYLSTAQGAYKSGTQYQDIFDQVNMDLESLGLTLEDQRSESEQILAGIEDELRQLNEDVVAASNAIEEAIWLSSLDYIEAISGVDLGIQKLNLDVVTGLQSLESAIRGGGGGSAQPIVVTVEVDREQIIKTSEIQAIADEVRVKAAKRPGYATNRAYY